MSSNLLFRSINPGCLYANASRPVGAFHLGCNSTCTCDGDGSVVCGQRCQPPFHQSGSRANDPLCVEQFVDECCVVITCAGNAKNEEEGPCTGILVSEQALTD